MKYFPATVILVLIMTLDTGTAAAETGDARRMQTPLVHAISSDKVQAVMEELNQLMSERGLSALQVMEKRADHLRALVSASEDLVVAAENLTEAIPGIRMTEESRVTFEALAKQLREEAETILYLAEETDYLSLEPAYQRMNDTCAACHRLFRFD